MTDQPKTPEPVKRWTILQGGGKIGYQFFKGKPSGGVESIEVLITPVGSVGEVERLKEENARMREFIRTCKYYLQDGEPVYQFSVDKLNEALSKSPDEPKKITLEEAVAQVKQMQIQMIEEELLRLTGREVMRPNQKSVGEQSTQELYNELIYQVGMKHDGETRHQTALRYIKQAEEGSHQENQAMDAERKEDKS